MTFRELIDEVLSFQFAAGKYETLVKSWLNEGQRKAALQSEFRSQEAVTTLTTEAGDGTVSLPADFGRFIDFNAERKPLSPLELRDFDTREASSGRPYAYAVAGNELNLYPTPDGSYGLSLRYWRLPAEMVNDSDEPEIPDSYHDVLIAYAMQKAYARENDYQAANYWENQWNLGVGKMRGEAQSDMADGPSQVEGSWPLRGTLAPTIPR